MQKTQSFKKYLLIAIAISLLIAKQIFSYQIIISSPADDLTRLMGGYHSMRADFNEVIHVQRGTETIDQRSYGQMALQRPGKFRWQVIGPNKQTIIADGQYLWFYDSDLNQVIKHAVDYKQPGNPAVLLIGNIKDLTKDFLVTRINTLAFSDAFKLSPRDTNSVYQEVRLYFMSGQLKAMTIIDNLGQKTEISFLNMKVNLILQPALFNFMVPLGADVVEQ